MYKPLSELQYAEAVSEKLSNLKCFKVLWGYFLNEEWNSSGEKTKILKGFSKGFNIGEKYVSWPSSCKSNFSVWTNNFTSVIIDESFGIKSKIVLFTSKGLPSNR